MEHLVQFLRRGVGVGWKSTVLVKNYFEGLNDQKVGLIFPCFNIPSDNAQLRDRRGILDAKSPTL